MLPRQAQPRRRDPRLAARALRRQFARLLAAGALLVAASGCGGDGDGGSGDGGSAAPPPAAEGTELTVTVHPHGRAAGERETAEVSCGAGDASDAEACKAIAALAEGAAAPVPPGVACTEIYGGPDVVELTGTLDGAEVDTELTRENGCEIDRFDRFIGLLRVLFPGYEPGAALMP